MGDLVGIEHYRWGYKDGVAQYFLINGNLRAEESWKALNPDKVYDTIQVEDVDKLNSYREVVVKNEGASLKHGVWKYYDPHSGAVVKPKPIHSVNSKMAIAQQVRSLLLNLEKLQNLKRFKTLKRRMQEKRKLNIKTEVFFKNS